MLNQIRSTSTPVGNTLVESTPEQMLLGCHQRIRHFSGMAVRLAASTDSPADEVKRAAENIYRYFTVALPLHEQDENLSLHPRLIRATLLPPSSSEATVLRKLAGPAADAMVEQHLAIDELVDRLLPLIRLVSNDPASLLQVAAEIGEISSALQSLFDSHLQLEEEIVIPAIAELLSEGERESLLREMKLRRV